LMALIVIAVGAAVELMTTRGLTTVYASLLGLIYGSFTAGNFAVTNQHFKHKKPQIVNKTDTKALDAVKQTTMQLTTAVRGMQDTINQAVAYGTVNKQVPK